MRTENIVVTAATGLVRIYQFVLGPWLGGRCRFYPSCSCYAIDALRQHGFLRGSWLALCRLFRCHPFHPGGVDLVPEKHAVTPMSPPGVDSLS